MDFTIPKLHNCPNITMCSSKVSSYLNLSDITLHLAVCLFDRTLAVAELDEKQLQMTAITCLHIASKVMVIIVTD